MPPTERPNLLFLFPDQHRGDWLGARDRVPVRTPNLDRLAERGVAFERAVCPAPLCGPSRACLASGMEYDRCGVRDHRVDYPLAARTYYGRLRKEAGYHVMGCGKFDLQKHSGDWGIDGQNNLAANGFSAGVNSAGYWDAYGSATGEAGSFTGALDPYMAYLAEHDLAEIHVADLARRRATGTAESDIDATFPTPLPEHAYCDNWIARTGLDLLGDAPEDRPWHLVVNFAGPHNPWDVTEAMHGWYRDPDVEFPAPVDADSDSRERFDATTHQAVRRNYATTVENIDRWVGRYLAELEDRGELQDTLVVFASDHGEMLGDRGQWYKRSPYQPSAGVPLVAAGPGVESRGLVDEPASVLDLHATFLDYAGVDPGAVDSRSLRPYLSGEADEHRAVAHSGMGPWRLAVDGRYKLIRGYDPDRSANEQVSAADAWDEAEVRHALGDHEPILFDLGTDPGETENVAAGNPGVVERLAGEIDAVRRAG